MTAFLNAVFLILLLAGSIGAGIMLATYFSGTRR